MAVIGAFTILVLFLGIGDVIAQKTKAYINSYFVFAVLLLLGFWVFKLPEDIIATSGATAIGTIACAFCMIHLATTIPLREFFKQWKKLSRGVRSATSVSNTCFSLRVSVSEIPAENTMLSPFFISTSK